MDNNFTQYELPVVPSASSGVQGPASSQVSAGNTSQPPVIVNQDSRLASRVESLEKYVADIYGNYAKLGGDPGFGTVDARNVRVSERLEANAGKIAGWDMQAGVLSTPKMSIDSNNQQIKSSNYQPGTSGFKISSELVEAENLIARGTLRGATFAYDQVSAVGGQLMIANADTLELSMSSSDNSTLTTKGDTSFVVNDILVMRGTTTSGIQEEWLRVTAKSGNTYTVARDLAGLFSPDDCPAWEAGTPVVKQGAWSGVSGNKYTAPTLTGLSTHSALSVFQSLGSGTNDGAVKLDINGTKTDVAISLLTPQAESAVYTQDQIGLNGYTFSTSFVPTNKTKIKKISTAYYYSTGSTGVNKINIRQTNVSGTILASSDDTTLTGPYQNYSDFNFSGANQITLSAGVTYWLEMVSVSGTPPNSGFSGATGHGGLPEWVYRIIYGEEQTAPASLAEVATQVQTALRAFTTRLETVTYSTDKFIITGVTPDYLIKVSSPSTGTDISGAGDTKYLDLANGSSIQGGYGSGGWLRLFGEGTNSPYYSVFKRLSGKYNDYVETCRLGNLNGFLDYSADEYGIAIGDANGYLKYDPTNGLRANISSLQPTFTAGESLTVSTPIPFYISTSDGKVYQCDDTNGAKLAYTGFILNTVSANGVTAGQVSGVVSGFSGLSVGSTYYLKKGSGNYIDETQASTVQITLSSFGRNSNYKKVAQSFTTGTTYKLFSQAKFKLLRSGSPTDNIVCKLYAIDKTTLLSTSTEIVGSTISNSGVTEYTFTFPGYVCAPSTQYFLELSRTGSLNDTNYYDAGRGTSSSNYSGGIGEGYNNTSWTGNLDGDNCDLYFKAGLKEAYSSGDIAITAGANSVKVGRAISPTQLLIYQLAI